jgi:hypothetical protein
MIGVPWRHPDHANAGADARLLPPIIPVVVHHSARGWTAPVAFSELLDVSADLRASLGRKLGELRVFCSTTSPR